MGKKVLLIGQMGYLTCPLPQASSCICLSFSSHTCCSCHLLASGRASGQRLVVGQGPSLPASHTAPGGELGLHPTNG